MRAARATISQIGKHLTQSNASNDTAMWQWESEIKKVKRVLNQSYGETKNENTALRATSDSSQVCFVHLHHHERHLNCQMGHHSELSPVGWNSAQSKCSAEVLEGQLVSFVPSSSAGHGCTLVCMNITC